MDRRSILSNPLINLNLDDAFVLSCPTCQSSNLVIKNKPHTQNTSHTIRYGREDYFSPSDHQERFINFLFCENAECKEVVSVVGSIFLEETYLYNDQGAKKLIEVHRPSYFDPPINIFPLTKAYPEEMITSLKAAFALFFFDNQACANRIRTFSEELLSHFDVPKTKIVKHKRKPILLHDRISIFEEKYPTESKMLMSIKHIGNAGSHNSKIEQKDNLIAFKLLEHVLVKLFDKSERQLKSISNKINKAKRPIKL